MWRPYVPASTVIDLPSPTCKKSAFSLTGGFAFHSVLAFLHFLSSYFLLSLSKHPVSVSFNVGLRDGEASFILFNTHWFFLSFNLFNFGLRYIYVCMCVHICDFDLILYA